MTSGVSATGAASLSRSPKPVTADPAELSLSIGRRQPAAGGNEPLACGLTPHPGMSDGGDRALNERHYGDLSGLNKNEAGRRWGEEQVRLWRRSYDVAPPNGESLKDTVARVLLFYCEHILPRALRGERVLVVAHGNSLRALTMVLDRLTPDTVPSLELATGVLIVYRLNADSTVASKQVFAG